MTLNNKPVTLEQFNAALTRVNSKCQQAINKQPTTTEYYRWLFAETELFTARKQWQKNQLYNVPLNVIITQLEEQLNEVQRNLTRLHNRNHHNHTTDPRCHYYDGQRDVLESTITAVRELLK